MLYILNKIPYSIDRQEEFFSYSIPRPDQIISNGSTDSLAAQTLEEYTDKPKRENLHENPQGIRSQIKFHQGRKLPPVPYDKPNELHTDQNLAKDILTECASFANKGDKNIPSTSAQTRETENHGEHHIPSTSTHTRETENQREHPIPSTSIQTGDTENMSGHDSAHTENMLSPMSESEQSNCSIVLTKSQMTMLSPVAHIQLGGSFDIYNSRLLRRSVSQPATDTEQATQQLISECQNFEINWKKFPHIKNSRKYRMKKEKRLNNRTGQAPSQTQPSSREGNKNDAINVPVYDVPTFYENVFPTVYLDFSHLQKQSARDPTNEKNTVSLNCFI